jgi:SEC-C motif
MTLIVALMAPTQAILVSDRRFTRNGRLFDAENDEKNKAAVLFCADGRVAVAFTGLAIAGRFETSRAMLRVLAEAGKEDHLLLPTIQRFATKMSEEIKKLNISAKDKHLRFIFAGYRYEQSTATPVLIQVTNVFDKSRTAQNLAADDFLLVAWRNRAPFGSFGFGMTAGVAPVDREKLSELLLQQRPAEALVNKAVDTIGNAADSPKSKNLVGKQCMSIVVPIRGGVIANYHSAKVKNKIYLPSSIVSTPNASFTNQGGFIEQLDVTGAPLVVPKVRRNRPCPCGSGKRYKSCCGREQTKKMSRRKKG